MSLLAQHGEMLRGASTSGADPFVAVTHVIGASGGTISAAVPPGAQAGDTLLMIARVRGDRGISPGPTGASTLIDQRIGSSGSLTSRQRIYAFAKAFEGDTQMVGSQSTSSAHGVSLYVLRGSIVSHTIEQVSSPTQEVTHTKSGTANGLLAVGLVIAGSGFTTADPAAPEWVQRGTDYYSNSDYFGVGYSRAHEGVSAVARIGDGVSLGGNGNPNAVCIFEVAP